MASPPNKPTVILCDATSQMLRELNFPIHRIGFHQLCVAIPRQAQNFTQCLSTDIYPYVAEYFGCPDCRCIERSIRDIILFAWYNGDPEAWAAYFPNLKKPPSNKLFICTLAARLR